MDKNTWTKHWNNAGGYNWETKRTLLTPIFSRLESEGKIGKVVVDVGSGTLPVSLFLSGHHKVISIDIAADTVESGVIKADVEKVAQKSSFTYKSALLQAAKFLQIDPRGESSEHVDTVIFSEILNYVDYREVLKGFTKFLKPGGRFIIINKPGRGFEYLFSKKTYKVNAELLTALAELGFQIEETYRPGVDHSEDDTQMMFLIVKKLA